MKFFECVYLQYEEDITIFEAELSQCGNDQSFLNYMLSSYDFTAEMPEEEPVSFRNVWLPSCQDYMETRDYMVTRDYMGHYAIYRKAWM